MKIKFEGYVEALEEERRKIQVFARELPLCLELVTQAIETWKQQMVAQSECSLQTTSDEGHVLEEFIPIKRTLFNDDDDVDVDVDDDDDDNDDAHMFEGSQDDDKDENDDNLSKKSEWLSSAQLWNQTPDLPAKKDIPKKVSITEIKKNGGGAFHPFKREKALATAKSPPVSSTGESGGCSSGGGGSSKKEEKEGQNQRKARRCWSSELHRRFLQALQQLGGPHVATPKQIRELMKVDGLTNDEVKSHLQKYRLHTRSRPNHSTQGNNPPQTPQFLVVGGIWVPPPEYVMSGEASGVSNPNTLYSPIAITAPTTTTRKQHRKKSKQFHSDGRCSSPATSSSTHTSTASPAC